MERKFLSLCISALLFSLPGVAATKIPQGFEVLAHGEEERVDVILAGKHVGLFNALVSFDSVKFLEPGQVLEALHLPVKKDSPDYQTILRALSQPLARNGALACDKSQSQNCGFLKTDTVNAIYDGSEGSVSLFMRQDWLPVDGRQAMYLTPDTENVENAFVHQQNINFVAQDDYSNLFMQGDGALGVTQNSYLALKWSFTASESEDESENDADVSNLFYRYDLAKRYYLQAGRMDNQSLFNAQGGNFHYDFLPLGPIDGARMGSTLSYLNPDQASQGTPVLVLLSHSSRVDAYRNNQLLGSFYLPAGNQTVDTSLFPDGSYNVELRIYESNQLVRTDNVPFSKSGGFNDGHIQWFIQGGHISQSDVNENNAVQAGARLPLFHILNLTAGGAVVDGHEFAETGASLSPDLGIVGKTNLTGSLFHSSEGGRGDSEQFGWSKNGWPSFNLYRFSADGEECSTPHRDTNSYTSLSCYESLNATLSTSISSWNTTVGYIRTENHSDNSTWQDERDFRDNVLTQTTENAVSKTWQLSASRAWNANSWIINGTLGVFRREDDGYDGKDNGIYLSFSLHQAPVQQNPHRSESTRLDVNYRDSEQSPSQLSYTAAHDWYWDDESHRELSLEAGGINTDTLDMSASGEIDGEYGNLNATLSDSYDNQVNDHYTTVYGSYNSSFALGRHGLQWGSAGFGEPSSAVLVNIEDVNSDEDKTSDDTLLNVRAGGGRPVTVSGEHEALFPLSPYQAMNVDVNEIPNATQGMTTIFGGTGKKNVMLLPGKMSVQTVSVEQLFGYIGTLKLPPRTHKYPLLGLNSRTLILSDDGGFTAEVPVNAHYLYLLSEKTLYRCSLEVKKQRLSIRYVGDSACQTISRNDLPEAVQHSTLAKIRDYQDRLDAAYNQ